MATTWKKVVVESSAGTIAQDTTGNSATATNVAYTGLTGSVPTWNQSTTGNSATATSLASPVNIGGVSFDGRASINLPGVNSRGNQDTTGNSASATALAVARTIGGVSFDGSANIDLPGVNASGNQNTSGNSATATALASSGGVQIAGVVTSGKATYTSGGDVSLTTSMADNVISPSKLRGKSGALANGSNGQFLESLGDGTFAWKDQTSANDSTMTVSVSGNVTGGGSFTGNQASDSSISIGMSATPSFTSLSTTGNVVVGGDLQVSGATISTTTETLEIADNKMVLNSDLGAGSNGVNSGIVVQRGKSGDDAVLFWDESDDAWHIGTEVGGDITRATSSRIATQKVVSSFDSSDTSVPTGGLQYDTSTGQIYLRTA